MGYPSKAKLKEMEAKLKDAEATLMVGPSSTPAEKFRWELCQSLVRYMFEKKLSQVDFSDLLGIDQARVSEIVNHRIDKVSTDKLLSYLERLHPGVQYKIAM
jgi:predicted XRE-type DNA-binding protein